MSRFTSIAALAVFTVGLAIPGSPAFAQEADTSDAADVDAFIQELEDHAADDPIALEFISEFSDLPLDTQVDAVEAFKDGSIVDDFRVIAEPEQTTRMDNPNTRGIEEWHTKAKNVVTLFGITFGEYNQDFYYTGTGSSVYSTDACEATFSGFTGFWSGSAASNAHWVSGGSGVCHSTFHYSLFFQGSSITMNQQLRLYVDGRGGAAGDLVNL